MSLSQDLAASFEQQDLGATVPVAAAPSLEPAASEQDFVASLEQQDFSFFFFFLSLSLSLSLSNLETETVSLLKEETRGEAIELLMKAARDKIARIFFICV